MNKEIKSYFNEILSVSLTDCIRRVEQKYQDEQNGIFECFIPEQLEFIVKGRKITNCEACPYFGDGGSMDPMWCKLYATKVKDVYDACIITNDISKTGFPKKCPLRKTIKKNA
jgi:hypothetical protein